MPEPEAILINGDLAAGLVEVVNGENGDGASDDDSYASADSMSNFDSVDEAEAPETLSRLAQVKVTWDKSDIEYWFTELESQMELYNIKSQWIKRVVTTNNLPDYVKAEVKDVLKLQKSALSVADKLIYKKLKTKVIKLFGKKEGERYDKAASLLLTTKPSALAKELTECLCQCNPPLQCCAAETVAGMWKRQLPPVVRAAIAGKSLRDDYETVLDHADEVFASQGGGMVSAIEEDDEVAAVGRGGARAGHSRGRGGYRGGQRGQRRGQSRGRGYGQGARGGQAGQAGQAGQGNRGRHPDGPPESACRNHWRFGKSAWSCLNTATCPWKDHISAAAINE